MAHRGSRRAQHPHACRDRLRRDDARGGAEHVGQRTRRRGTLYWGIETKLQTVNPHRNGQDKAGPILRNAFDSYLYRTESGEYQPWLAPPTRSATTASR